MTTATRTTTNDEQLQQDVLAELRWDARVRPAEVGVAVKDGVVTLSGTVDSYPKRWAAEEAAQRVVGVRAVANDMEVQLPSAGRRIDADIASAAAQVLEWDTTIPSDAIDVTVAEGVVTLTGEVQWQYEKEDAEQVVRRLAGVRGVTNLIRVRPQFTTTSEDVKAEIEDALVRRAEIDADKITVEMQGSTAVLRGTVRSWAERTEAEQAAWNAPGVLTVENRITVGA